MIQFHSINIGEMNSKEINQVKKSKYITNHKAPAICLSVLVPILSATVLMIVLWKPVFRKKVPLYLYVVTPGIFPTMSTNAAQYTTQTGIMFGSGPQMIMSASGDKRMIPVYYFSSDTRPELGIEQRFLTSSQVVPVDTSGNPMKLTYGVGPIGYIYGSKYSLGLLKHLKPVNVLVGTYIYGARIELLSHFTTLTIGDYTYSYERTIGYSE